jgi:hypothetical protein
MSHASAHGMIPSFVAPCALARLKGARSSK